jgi:hypothetical protein
LTRKEQLAASMTVDKCPRRALEDQSHQHADSEHAADAECSVTEAIGQRNKRDGIEPVADLGDDSGAEEYCDIPFDEDSAILIENPL